MIGNNSCGATAQRTGKIVDNVVRLEVLLYDGIAHVGRRNVRRRICTHRPAGAVAGPRSTPRCGRFVTEYAAEISRRFPDIPRRVSGYNLDSL